MGTRLNKGKNSSKLIKAAEMQRDALELRKSGAGFQVIADTMGVSVATAFRLVTRALQKIQHPQAQQLLDLELERLDALLFAVWDKAMAGELGAVDRAESIIRRRARLLGLEKVDGSVQVNIVALLQEASRQSISMRSNLDGVELPPIGEPLPVLSSGTVAEKTGEVIDAAFSVVENAEQD